ncbi:hypothetical protein INR49_022023 [Caranx melampygus]|nr:hypothetical protein INR49_022023 [Caranx melampygus]
MESREVRGGGGGGAGRTGSEDEDEDVGKGGEAEKEEEDERVQTAEITEDATGDASKPANGTADGDSKGQSSVNKKLSLFRRLSFTRAKQPSDRGQPPADSTVSGEAAVQGDPPSPAPPPPPPPAPGQAEVELSRNLCRLEAEGLAPGPARCCDPRRPPSSPAAAGPTCGGSVSNAFLWGSSVSGARRPPAPGGATTASDPALKSTTQLEPLFTSDLHLRLLHQWDQYHPAAGRFYLL